MAYFTFSEQTARKAIKWMLRERDGHDHDPTLGQEMVEEFMACLGYDECLGLSSARENMIAEKSLPETIQQGEALRVALENMKDGPRYE